MTSHTSQDYPQWYTHKIRRTGRQIATLFSVTQVKAPIPCLSNQKEEALAQVEFLTYWGQEDYRILEIFAQQVRRSISKMATCDIRCPCVTNRTLVHHEVDALLALCIPMTSLSSYYMAFLKLSIAIMTLVNYTHPHLVAITHPFQIYFI